ncbi:TIGR04255 family protein [Clavibacter sp. VKM Ac-2872]|uniref:TIGR04255 family protein n=1 Tax=Clavibacter sp. VKM Ac-2872 TaxID=2783812 RepID=UPI00188C9A6C|nr:TIGR04255 family protein [Clavibacter sp. VKM Ac-2872]MBF4623087.1 TIGR04255 family protein [Clavibacter sp. VKM Ac-2872]
MTPTGAAADHSTKRGFRLSKAPLVRVLAQIRWHQLAGYDVDTVAKALSARLAKEYPLVTRNHEAELTITPEGIQQQAGTPVHRLSSLNEEWIVNLGETFLSLETTAYKSHEDFVARLSVITTALNEVYYIPFWTRFGYRYTNRIDQEFDLDRINEYFNASVLGGLALDQGGELVHSISESVYKQGDVFLLVRSARLPKNASIDPSLPAVNTPSWSLDLDAYEENKSPEFTTESIAAKATELARVGYYHFRAVITDEFVARFQ